MTNAAQDVVNKTVDFLKSIGHEVSAEELKTHSPVRAEWTHKIPFIGK